MSIPQRVRIQTGQFKGCIRGNTMIKIGEEIYTIGASWIDCRGLMYSCKPLSLDPEVSLSSKKVEKSKVFYLPRK